MNKVKLKDKLPFFIPFHYLFTTRLQNSILHLLSWLFIFAFPTFYYGLLPFDGALQDELAIFTIYFIAVVNIYEWGYIQNDTLATLHEEDPTRRLSSEVLDFAIRNTFIISLWRISITAFILYMMKPNDYFFWSVVLIPFLFAGYNRWRGTMNVFLYPLLVASRFVPFMLLTYPLVDCVGIVLLLFIYPVEIGLERFSMPRYRFEFMRRFIPNEELKPRFRVAYYTVITLVLLALVSIGYLEVVYVVPYCVFILYRVILWYICHKRQHKVTN